MAKLQEFSIEDNLRIIHIHTSIADHAHAFGANHGHTHEHDEHTHDHAHAHDHHHEHDHVHQAGVGHDHSHGELNGTVTHAHAHDHHHEHGHSHSADGKIKLQFKSKSSPADDKTCEVFTMFDQLGIRPGVEITLKHIQPEDSSITICLGEATITLKHSDAALIEVVKA